MVVVVVVLLLLLLLLVLLLLLLAILSILHLKMIVVVPHLMPKTLAVIRAAAAADDDDGDSDDTAAVAGMEVFVQTFVAVAVPPADEALCPVLSATIEVLLVLVVTLVSCAPADAASVQGSVQDPEHQWCGAASPAAGAVHSKGGWEQCSQLMSATAIMNDCCSKSTKGL
jgi:hypothetical protein